MTFEDIIKPSSANRENYEALRDAIRAKTVVPFTGAGMSAAYYPLWGKALDILQDKIEPKDAANAEMDAAKTEIDRCDVIERHLGKRRTCRALCELFSLSKYTDDRAHDIREQPVALLPRLFPDAPLITTNLDRMQEEVYRQFDAPFKAVLNPSDHDILEALKVMRAHGMLYLHGCVSEDLTDYSKLVFSKAQYDQHYRDDSPLVHALQGWMSGAQLLFLGCSLRTDRTLEILKKVCRDNSHVEHFAILGLEDEDFTARMNQLDDEYHIRAILYPKDQHEAVRIVLQQLLDEIHPDAPRKTDEATRYSAAEYFRGRDALVGEVVDYMRRPDASILLVQGVAGIGKTEICKAAYRALKQIDANFEMPFIDLSAAKTLLEFFVRLAEGLKIKLPEIPPEKVPGFLREAIAERLNGRRRWVYLDNFEDVWQPLEKADQKRLSDELVMLKNLGLRMLISSQVKLDGVKIIPVGSLDGEVKFDQLSPAALNALDRATLFVEILNRKIRADEQPAFAELLKATAGHPLSIVLTASYGRDCGSLGELLDCWHGIEQHIPGDRDSHDSLKRALALAFSSVAGDGAALRRWALHALSLFPLDEQTLSELRKKLPTAYADSEWRDAGRRLRALGLVTMDDDGAEHMLLPVKKPFAALSTDKAAENEALRAWADWGAELLARGDNDKNPDYYALHDRALDWLSQCLNLAEVCAKQGDYDNLIILLFFAGNFYSFDIARSVDLLGLLLRRVPEDFPLRGQFHAILGDLLREVGQLDEALEANSAAEKFFRKKQDNIGLANVLSSRGALLTHVGQLDEALAVYDVAEKLYRKEQDNRSLANVLMSRGRLLIRTGQLDEALAAYDAAEKLYRKELGDFGSANVLVFRADLLRQTGQFDKALAAYEAAEKLYRAERYNLGVANMLHLRGDMLSCKGQFDDALAAYEQAEQLYRMERSNLGLTNVLRSRGGLLLVDGDWAGACVIYERALALYRQLRDPMSICYTLSDLQLCERLRGREAEAQAYIDELMELLPKQPKPVQEYANWKLEEGMTEPGAGQANAQD